MTIDSAKDLQMNIAKEGLALLMFHPPAMCSSTESASPSSAQRGISLWATRRRSPRCWTESWMQFSAGEGGTVAHVLSEDELSMHATDLETLDNIWDLFETSLRMDSTQARTKMFEMAKWLEESQKPSGLDRAGAEGKAGMDGADKLSAPYNRVAPRWAAPPFPTVFAPVSRRVCFLQGTPR